MVLVGANRSIPKSSKTPDRTSTIAAGRILVPKVEMGPAASDVARHGRVPSLIQNRTFEGKPATERSEAYLGYNQRNLYIVLLCGDHDHGVRSSLTRREPPITNHDNRPFDSDDYVEITLDTFQDQRHGFV